MSKDKKRKFICGKCRCIVREKSGTNICKRCKAGQPQLFQGKEMVDGKLKVPRVLNRIEYGLVVKVKKGPPLFPRIDK